MNDNSAVDLGAPADLEFGVAVGADNRVVLKFNKLIQWFDLEPSVAVDYAEAIINAAVEAKRREAQTIVEVKKPELILPGLPGGQRIN